MLTGVAARVKWLASEWQLLAQSGRSWSGIEGLPWSTGPPPQSALALSLLGRDRALAFTQATVPGGGSESFHGSCSFRVVHVPQLAGVSAPPGRTATASIRRPR